MPDIACAVGGTAVITVRVLLGVRGTPERAGSSAPGRPIQDRLQLITPSFFSACSCSVGWSGVHDRSQRVSRRRLAGRLPIRADPETIHRSVVQPVTQLVATGRRSQDQQRQDRHAFVFTNSIKESLRLADPLRESPSPASAETPQQLDPSNASTSKPGCSPDVPRRPKTGQRRLHRVLRTSDHTGLPSTRVTASVLGDALGMVGRPVSTGLRDSCRLSSFLTRWTAGG